jgi:importin-7
MDAQQLHLVLKHTISPEKAARDAAAEQITNLHTVRGALLLLIQFVAEETVERDVRQAAAISLKNVIQKHWDGDFVNGELVRVIPDDERMAVRQHVLEVRCLFVSLGC